MNATRDAHHPEGDVPRPGRRAFALLFAAALLHGLTYLAIVPPWMGEDEPWHVEYAHHVGQGRAPWGGIPLKPAKAGELDDRTWMNLSQLQVRRRFAGVTAEEIADAQRAITASMRAHAFWARVGFAGWEPGTESFDEIALGFTATHQPFLYYLLGGGVLRLLGVVGVLGIEAELWVLRALSLLCYLAVVAATFALGRIVARDEWIALACALFVAWLPMHARQAAVVNNDVLAKVFSALAILFALRLVAHGGRSHDALLALLFAGLGLCTKPTAAGALAVVAPALAWRFRAHFGRPRGTAIALTAVALVAGGAVLYWLTTNNPVLPRSLVNLRYRIGEALSPELHASVLRTLAGSFCWETRSLAPEVNAALGIALASALLGALWVLVRGRSDVDRRAALLCFAAVLFQLFLVAMRGEGRGRYLFTVLPALGALVAIGFLGPLPARRRPAAFGLLALALVAYDALFLWRGLLWHEYGRWGS